MELFIWNIFQFITDTTLSAFLLFKIMGFFFPLLTLLSGEILKKKIQYILTSFLNLYYLSRVSGLPPSF